MALTVRDLMNLQCFNYLELIAGQRGLSRKVAGMGILEYELMPEFIDEYLQTFTPGDFVLCSFLYQYCCKKPEEILPMVKHLYHYGVAGIGFKKILYPALPQEVLDFANQNDFPIFRFGKDIYYENLVYEITDALQTDDRNLLHAENIDRMISGTLPQNRIYSIAKNLSLSFKPWCCAAYLCAEDEAFRIQMERGGKNLYLNRNLDGKAMLVPYRSGVFILMTASKKESKAFQIILDEILAYLNLRTPFYCCASRVHDPFESLDHCLKESYNTYLASVAEGRNITSYDKLGVYEILVGDYRSIEMSEYMQRYLGPFQARQDYLDTAIALVRAGGDIAKAAEIYGCHQNTIRYKLTRMRELVDSASASEQDFYINLSLAVRIYQLRQAAK